ncbi:MAG TPA: hypothetical protein VFP34_04055 [Microlunatus sp.]|nr:hypothetical protein [Microlunatus sp.]
MAPQVHVVGDLRLSFEAMDLPADPGLSLVVYSAEPGSSSDGVRLLASWVAESAKAPAAGHPMNPVLARPRCWRVPLSRPCRQVRLTP